MGCHLKSPMYNILWLHSLFAYLNQHVHVPSTCVLIMIDVRYRSKWDSDQTAAGPIWFPTGVKAITRCALWWTLQLRFVDFDFVNVLFNDSVHKKRTNYKCLLKLATWLYGSETQDSTILNRLKPELNPICYLLALLGAHHFLHVSRIRVKLLTFRRLMSYIYGSPILDTSRPHTTTQHSR